MAHIRVSGTMAPPVGQPAPRLVPRSLAPAPAPSGAGGQAHQRAGVGCSVGWRPVEGGGRDVLVITNIKPGTPASRSGKAACRARTHTHTTVGATHKNAGVSEISLSLSLSLCVCVHIGSLDPRRADSLGACGAGMEKGDLLLTVDGQPLAACSSQQIRAMLLGPPGSRVTLELVRSGGAAYQLTLERQPKDADMVSQAGGGDTSSSVGHGAEAEISPSRSAPHAGAPDGVAQRQNHGEQGDGRLQMSAHATRALQFEQRSSSVRETIPDSSESAPQTVRDRGADAPPNRKQGQDIDPGQDMRALEMFQRCSQVHTLSCASSHGSTMPALPTQGQGALRALTAICLQWKQELERSKQEELQLHAQLDGLRQENSSILKTLQDSSDLVPQLLGPSSVSRA